MPHDHHDMAMPMNDPPDPAALAKLQSDKRESEFNHHLAGFFVLLAGAFLLVQGPLTVRWSRLRFVWPLCFLLSGIFVFIFSDTELWPFGPKNWVSGVFGNSEVIQHKLFAILLLALGIIEMQRARGRLKTLWSGMVFSFCAFAGSVLLLFHSHDAGMVGPDPMASMYRIQMQHYSYSLVGTGIGLSSGLSQTSTPWRTAFKVMWPLLMMVLGMLLIGYME